MKKLIWIHIKAVYKIIIAGFGMMCLSSIFDRIGFIHADYCSMSGMRLFPPASSKRSGPKDKVPKLQKTIQSTQTGRCSKSNEDNKAGERYHLRG